MATRALIESYLHAQLLVCVERVRSARRDLEPVSVGQTTGRALQPKHTASARRAAVRPNTLVWQTGALSHRAIRGPFCAEDSAPADLKQLVDIVALHRIPRTKQ